MILGERVPSSLKVKDYPKKEKNIKRLKAEQDAPMIQNKLGLAPRSIHVLALSL
jgi:hypothetical protein